MKKIAQVLPFVFFAFTSLVFAQENVAEWVRVQNDNGEFSIEVPTKHNYFYDKEGFSVSNEISKITLSLNWNLRDGDGFVSRNVAGA